MRSPTPSAPPFEFTQLKAAILDFLHQGETCSEFELLTHLARTHAPFQTDRSDSLQLFRQHFILFHCLYRLQQELWASASGDLSISPLAIRLQAYQPGQSVLTVADPLRTYYLDLGQLTQTDRDKVDTLLGEFWIQLARRDRRQAALALLDLQDPVDDKVIKRRYRELVMAHHPDRGGDTVRLQLLNAALADLLPTGGQKSH